MQLSLNDLVGIFSYLPQTPAAVAASSQLCRLATESEEKGLLISSNEYKRVIDSHEGGNYIDCNIDNYMGAMCARWWLRRSTVPELLNARLEQDRKTWGFKSYELRLRISKRTSVTSGEYTCSLGDIVSLGMISQLHIFETVMNPTLTDLLPVLTCPVGLKTLRIRHTTVDLNDFLSFISTNAPTISVLELSYFTIPTLDIVSLCPFLSELELRGTDIPCPSEVSPVVDKNIHQRGVDLSEEDKPFSALSNLRFLRRLDLSHMSRTNFSGLARCSTLRTLNLSSAVIDTSDLKAVGELSLLRDLFLSNTPIDSLEPLKGCTNLQMLQLSGTRVTSDGLFLEPFAALRHLDLSRTGVSSLRPLSVCHSLMTLLLAKTKITTESFDEFTPLFSLEHLVVSDTVVASLSPAARCPHLKRLHSKNTLVDSNGLQGIGHLAFLEELHLSHTRVTSVTGLSGLQRLQRLELFGSPVNAAGLQGLSDLSQLQSLVLSRTAVESIQPLSGCPSLTELIVRESRLTSLQGVESIPSLESLSVTHSSVTNLEALSPLTRLRQLNLWHSQLRQLEVQWMAPLTSLEVVDLAQTPLVSVTALFVCSRLTTITLSGTLITSLDGVERLPQLRFLDVAHTPLVSLQPLAGCSTLETLHLSHTNMEDAGFVRPGWRLTALQKIYLSSTLVRRIGALGECAYLEEVYAQNCPITGDGLLGLERALRLKKVNLASTLIQTGVTVLCGCRDLQKLNLRFTDVPLEEVQELRRCLPHCRISEDAEQMAQRTEL